MQRPATLINRFLQAQRELDDFCLANYLSNGPLDKAWALLLGIVLMPLQWGNGPPHPPVRDRGPPPSLLTREQRSALAFDDSELGPYERDEREFMVFTGLHYSSERLEWLARFVRVHPDAAAPEETEDATFAEVQAWGRRMQSRNIKPSQSALALTAFWAQLDREVDAFRNDR